MEREDGQLGHNLLSSQVTSHLNKVPIKIQSLSLFIGSGRWQAAWKPAFPVPGAQKAAILEWGENPEVAWKTCLPRNRREGLQEEDAPGNSKQAQQVNQPSLPACIAPATKHHSLLQQKKAYWDLVSR